MGRDLAQTFTAAREVFDEVDAALGENLSRLMFDSDSAEKLAHTENAQPAILAHSIAAFRAVHRELGSPSLPAFASSGLGHSLGEYSALVATGVISLWDAARLVRIRGRAMQSACVPNEEYAMAALMGAPPAEASAENKFAIEIEKLCHSVLADVQSMKSRTRVCSIANVNSRSQVVLSGHRDAVQLVTEKAKSAKLARRVTFLNVSAPFHCSIMQPAVEILSAAISRIKLDDSTIPLISNHNGSS
jgi:[acyl-carrier-protein] S-malonyltransferase